MANIPISDFPAASSANASDVLAGVQDDVTKKFSFAIVLNWIKQQITSLFVPISREINGKDLSTDITLDASDVGAVDTADVGVADGVASLDSNGKVPGTQLDLSGKQNKITANGILKGDGQGGVSAATAGTDYATPTQLEGKANQAQLAYVESGTTATKTNGYAVGEYFCLDGLLYRAIQPIANGDTFTPGTNCEQKYVTGMAVRWVDISGTSGGSSAVSVTALSGVNNVSGIILAVVDNNATVTSALSLSLYKSGNSWGAALVDMQGNRKANTAFNLRLYYVLI